jgi:hypothetical protein
LDFTLRTFVLAPVTALMGIEQPRPNRPATFISGTLML